MKVKQLLGQVGFKAIFEYIKEFTRAFYYEDFMSAAETYDTLTNSDDQPVSKEPAAKYTLELKVALLNKNAPERAYTDDIVAALFYSLFTQSGRSYSISDRYVKSLADFSECEVKMNKRDDPTECAALIVLSFAVLNEKIKSAYGNISSASYIYMLKFRPSDDEDE